MDDNGNANGGGNATHYVSFGPGETQEMPVEWAQEMLTRWREKYPIQFGRTLAEVVTGVAPKGR
jgi:hypothetical protein